MRILLMPDMTTAHASGTLSALATIAQLRSLGHEVAVIDNKEAGPRPASDGVSYHPAPTALRWYEHIASPKLTSWFDRLCDAFQPDYLLMIGRKIVYIE